MIPSYLPHDVFTLTRYDEVGTEEDDNLWEEQYQIQEHNTRGGMEQ